MRVRLLRGVEKKYRIRVNAEHFKPKDEVDTPDGQGVVLEQITESFEDPDGGEVEASEDEPVYAVAVEDEDVGMGFYKGSELSDTTIETDVENPEEDLDEATENGETTANQDGFFEWPESWVESETPARVIALKALAGMGGTFDSCVREMRGEIVSPDRFCADFLDRVYGNPFWRGDSFAPGD